MVELWCWDQMMVVGMYLALLMDIVVVTCTDPVYSEQIVVHFVAFGCDLLVCHMARMLQYRRCPSIFCLLYVLFIGMCMMHRCWLLMWHKREKVSSCCMHLLINVLLADWMWPDDFMVVGCLQPDSCRSAIGCLGIVNPWYHLGYWGSSKGACASAWFWDGCEMNICVIQTQSSVSLFRLSMLVWPAIAASNS